MWAVVAASTIGVGWFTSTSGFFFDDYIYFREAQRQGISLSFLAQPLNVHLSPGHRVTDWFLQRFFPLDFPLAQALLLIGLAASMIVLYRVLTALFGPGPGPVLLTFLYGTSLVQVGVLQWWSASLQSLPSSLLSLVCILTWLGFFRTGSPRLLAVSVMALALALLFYVKPVLVPLELLALRVLVVEPERPLRATLAAARREWRVWLCYLLPVGLYGAVYLAGYWQPSSLPTADLIIDYLRLSWVRLFVPSVVGFHVGSDPVSTLTTASMVAAQVAVVALVVWSCRRSAAAWRGWAFLGLAFVSNALLVGVPRLAQWGSGVASFYRYYPEVTYLLPIALGAALLRPARTRRSVASPQGRALLVAAIAAHLVLAWPAAERISKESPGRLAGPWIDNVRSSLDRIDGTGVTPTIVDGTVPEFVVASWAVYGPPYHDRFSEVLPLLDAGLTFDRLGGDLFEVSGDGSLRPVAFVAEAGGWAPGLLDEGRLRVTDGALVDGRDGLCITAGSAPATVELGLDRPAMADPGGVGRDRQWYLVADPVASTEPPTLWVDHGAGYPPSPDATLAPTGSGELVPLIRLGGPRPRRLRVEIAAGDRSCLGRVEVGRLVPRA